MSCFMSCPWSREAVKLTWRSFSRVKKIVDSFRGTVGFCCPQLERCFQVFSVELPNTNQYQQDIPIANIYIYITSKQSTYNVIIPKAELRVSVQLNHCCFHLCFIYATKINSVDPVAKRQDGKISTGSGSCSGRQGVKRRGPNKEGLQGWAYTSFAGWWFPIFFVFIPILGKMIQFDEHIFQMG